MRIDDLRQEREDNWITVSARLTWEESDRPAQRIRFQVDESLADDVECNPNAFLVAAAAPAMYYGERRLAIEGALCPVLREGVLTALAQLRAWHGPSRTVPAIEAKQGYVARKPRTPGRAAQFFSGGTDALTTLRMNRQMYPADHPAAIRDCLHVYGLHPADYPGGEPCPERMAAWERNRRQLSWIQSEADVELHSFRTNVTGLFDKVTFQAEEYHSAVLLSLAHLVPGRFCDVFIASSDHPEVAVPWGSHPLIDPNYSSSYLRIHHDGFRMKRLDKLCVLAQWPAALRMLSVCVNNSLPEDRMNCGRCYKCVRTMTELLVCGRLANAVTFPDRDVRPEWFADLKLRCESEIEFLSECLEPLRAMERFDLVEAIEDRVADYHAWKRRKEGLTWKARLRNLDQQYLGGQIARNWQAIRNPNTAIPVNSANPTSRKSANPYSGSMRPANAG